MSALLSSGLEGVTAVFRHVRPCRGPNHIKRRGLSGGQDKTERAWDMSWRASLADGSGLVAALLLVISTIVVIAPADGIDGCSVAVENTAQQAGSVPVQDVIARQDVADTQVDIG